MSTDDMLVQFSVAIEEYHKVTLWGGISSTLRFSPIRMIAKTEDKE
jgi:hypothetical protein